MKPSYAIGAKNGLLDQKHLDALGNAIWLYLWLLDRQPKDTDKVLGGKPVTYAMFAESFAGVPRVTYVRWLEAIKAGGYVDLLRTPRGYVITIAKPKKWGDVSKMTHQSDSDVSLMTHHSKSDVSKMDSDVSKMTHAEDVSKMTHAIKRNSLDIQEETQLSIESKPAAYGRPDINEVFSYWNEMVGFPISSRIKQNRAAVSNLIKKHGVAGVKKLITGVALAHGDRYGPNISDFSELQSNFNKLILWGRKQGGNSAVARF